MPEYDTSCEEGKSRLYKPILLQISLQINTRARVQRKLYNTVNETHVIMKNYDSNKILVRLFHVVGHFTIDLGG